GDLQAEGLGVARQLLASQTAIEGWAEMSADTPLPEAGDLRQRRLVESVAVHQAFQRRGLATAPFGQGLGFLFLELRHGQLRGVGLGLPASTLGTPVAALFVHGVEQLAVAAVAAVGVLRDLV